MPRLFAHFAQDDGCRFHRLLQPARFVPQDLPGVSIHAATNPPCRADRYDVYAIHGLPVASTWEGVANFKHWAGEGGRRGKWVWSLDDDFLTVPDWNPAKPPEPAMAHYYLARDAADFILVSTPALAATFADLNGKVLTAPNLIDLTLYPTPDPAPLADGERLRILWHGGPTHRHDVDVVVPAVQHVLTKYAGRVEAIWFGQGVPPDLAASHLHKGLTWQQGVELGLYWSVLKAIRPHVVLAPLNECPFNLSKSNIRILDGWALSTAVLATPWGEYECVRDMEDGLVCRDPVEWAVKLERLIEDAELRLKLATAGRRRVESEWAWQSESARRPWKDAVSKIMGL